MSSVDFVPKEFNELNSVFLDLQEKESDFAEMKKFFLDNLASFKLKYGPSKYSLFYERCIASLLLDLSIQTKQSTKTCLELYDTKKSLLLDCNEIIANTLQVSLLLDYLFKCGDYSSASEILEYEEKRLAQILRDSQEGYKMISVRKTTLAQRVTDGCSVRRGGECHANDI